MSRLSRPNAAGNQREHELRRRPLIVGGQGPRRTPALAARYAVEFNVPFAAVAPTREQFERVRAACEAAGRDTDELVYSNAVTVCSGESDSELRRRAQVPVLA